MPTTGAMEALTEQLPSLVGMLGLLILSSFFSGAETALFSLTAYDRLQLRREASGTGELVDQLLHQPQHLLLTILFSNLAVNVFTFAISSVVVYRLVHSHHPFLASGVGILTLLSVVLFGEILPKALAYYLRITVSRLVAPPLWILDRLLWPVMSLVRWLIVLPAVNILTGPTSEQQIHKEELHHLVDAFEHEKLIQADQARLLKNVIELQDLKVRQIMKPRVNLVCCPIDASLEYLSSLIHEQHPAVVLIYRHNVDDIIGMVRTRRLWLRRPATLADVLEPLPFVPEQQRVDQLVHFFHRTDANTAAVIDEYGGLAGLVQVHDVVEELLGKTGTVSPGLAAAEIQTFGKGQYAAEGSVEIEDFCSRFDVPEPDVAVETLGGLVMSLLGHLPQTNESVDYHGLILRASQVEQSRVKRITIIDRRDRDGITRTDS